MKKFLRAYFTFNQVEVKGIRVLLIIVFLLFTFYLCMPFFFNKKETFDFSKYQSELEEFQNQIEIDSNTYRSNSNKKYTKKYYPKSKVEKGNYELHPFNPNGLETEEWVAMGLSVKQAEVIKKFEQNGGTFKTREDVKKLFVITEEFYQKIEPYLVFNETNEVLNEDIAGESNPLSLDINLVTKEDFLLIDGIKDYLAERIVQHREKLGGFIHISQLKEVKYLSDYIYNKLKPHCFIGEVSIKKIRVNYADFKTLLNHPYIDYELAGEIIDHRKQFGFFNDANHWKESGLVNDSLNSKLVPYLDFSK